MSEDAHCPLNLPCFNDLEEARVYALQAGKPLLLDFTGWGCVNCRKMEEEVWSRPEVRKRLAEDVVLVSLYVDERTPLPREKCARAKLRAKPSRRLAKNGAICRPSILMPTPSPIMC